MDATAATLNALLAQQQIRDCIANIARGEDRRDAARLRASFWPDAACDFGIFSGDFSAYLAWVVPGAAAVAVTQHVLGQTLIELQGDSASAETHVLAYHRVDMGEALRDTIIGGRYLDVAQRRNAEWRLAHRTMLYDWVQDAGISADWSQGLMGMKFSAGHYTGRANADFSETFFNGDSSGR